MLCTSQNTNLSDEAVKLGVVKFMPQESFEDPAHGLSRDAQRERTRETLLALLHDQEPPKPLGDSVGDWPRVHHAICRDGMFVVETSTPPFTAMLRFSPKMPNQGQYEIRRRPHGGVQRGFPYAVKEVPKDEKCEPASLLARFAVRYVVFTTADDRAGTRLAWLVGLNSFRNVDETVDTNMEAS